MVFHQNGSQVSMAQMNLTDVDLPSLTSALDRLLLDLRRSTQEDLFGLNVGILGNWESLRKEDDDDDDDDDADADADGDGDGDDDDDDNNDDVFLLFQYDHAKGQRKQGCFFERPVWKGFFSNLAKRF